MEGSRLCPWFLHHPPPSQSPGVRGSRESSPQAQGSQGPGMPSCPEMRAEKIECQPPLVSSVFTTDCPPASPPPISWQ